MPVQLIKQRPGILLMTGYCVIQHLSLFKTALLFAAHSCCVHSSLIRLWGFVFCSLVLGLVKFMRANLGVFGQTYLWFCFQKGFVGHVVYCQRVLIFGLFLLLLWFLLVLSRPFLIHLGLFYRLIPILLIKNHFLSLNAWKIIALLIESGWILLLRLFGRLLHGFLRQVKILYFWSVFLRLCFLFLL